MRNLPRYNEVALGMNLAEVESMWFVVTLSPWIDESNLDDQHPEPVYWCGDHWSFDLGIGDANRTAVVYTYRQAVKVAENLEQPDWANGPALPMNVADWRRHDEHRLCSMYRDYTLRVGPLKHKKAQQSLEALLARGLHKEQLT